MPSISLQQGIIYGPVFSRRLGRSLGVNLLPISKKVCSFDCLYCQYGETAQPILAPSQENFPDVDSILRNVEKALRKPRTIDTLTLSGNGEPTLHPDFLSVVAGIKALKDHYCPKAKLALLSNSSRILEPDIVTAISLIDLPMMKLDAGDSKTFKAINRPVDEIRFEDILEGLGSLPNLMIQSVLIDGQVSNVSGDAYETLAIRLAELQPTKLHIYSSERPTASRNVKCVPSWKLEQIEADLSQRFGLEVEAFWFDR